MEKYIMSLFENKNKYKIKSVFLSNFLIANSHKGYTILHVEGKYESQGSYD